MLTAMHGDPKKQQVAAAQAYFASMAETVRSYIQSVEDVERIVIRDEISEREKSLSGVAKAAGVSNYGFFQNAGYRGLYNCNINQLKLLKNTPPSRSPLDFMGKQESAANLFRIAQTEATIRNKGIKGQRGCESIAENVGLEVRRTMEATSGQLPEDLAPVEDIREVKKLLKTTQKNFQKIDTKK